MPEIRRSRRGDAARFAGDEFSRAEIRNPNTRRAYAQAVRRFLAWTESRDVRLHAITLVMVCDCVDQLVLRRVTIHNSAVLVRTSAVSRREQSDKKRYGLNCQLIAIKLVYETKKPSGIIAEGLISEKSRGDRI